ncbi:hypothetical protein X734_28685 [Mesorhizobium sp. L2C084A000]|nr:hypothetical protein X734_28685 [Mesorhizobium sp. L2C084A000]
MSLQGVEMTDCANSRHSVPKVLDGSYGRELTVSF